MISIMKRALLPVFVFAALALSALAQTSGAAPPNGKIIDSVECAADPAQHYALYLPSNYTPVRKWSVILAFDAGARGRMPVERYQQAAEKYGYIVAGSLNSRNGPWEISKAAAKAMTADVLARFSIDPKRMYTAGMSGGARVAMEIALSSHQMAGVFASSAGFPDDFMASVLFAVYGSAGTDDFNHLEMSDLDRDMTSPHRVMYFEGPHTWLPVELATYGVEWMELQAMRSGLRPRDAAAVDQIFASRLARLNAQKENVEILRELNHLVIDFDGFKDVSKYSERAAMLAKDPQVKEALKAERSAQEREIEAQAEIYQLRDRMRNPASFTKLKERVNALLVQSKAEQDSADRRIARRVLTGFVASSRGIQVPEFQDLLDQIRPRNTPPGAERP